MSAVENGISRGERYEMKETGGREIVGRK